MAGQTSDGSSASGRATVLLCPQCNSPVDECGDGSRFRCRRGHQYTAGELYPGVEQQLRDAWAHVVRALVAPTS